MRDPFLRLITPLVTPLITPTFIVIGLVIMCLLVRSSYFVSA